MQNRRFRDVKQKKPNSDQTSKKQPADNQSRLLPYASIGNKTKAFITDIFMLMMPIMYAVAYLVMGGLQGFSEHLLEGWIYIIVPNFIIVFIFFWRSSQTPGCKAYNIKLVDSRSGNKAHPVAIALRYYFELFSIITIFGLAMAFFRKDRKCLHDLLSGTVLIDTDQTK